MWAYVEPYTNTDRHTAFSPDSHMCRLMKTDLLNQSLRDPRFQWKSPSFICTHTHTRTFYIQHIQLTDSLREINEREKGSDQQHTYNPKRKTTFSQGHLFDKEQCLGAYPVPVRVSIPFRSTLLTLLLFLLEWREWDKERKWIANSHCFWCVSMTCLSIAWSSILIQTELVFFFLQSFHFQWTAICTQFECKRLARLGRSIRIHHTCWFWSFVLFYWITSF